MKAGEIRNMTEAEIEHQILTLKEQLFKKRADGSSGRVERPNEFRVLKRDIARCHTILKEKKGEGLKT